MQTDIIMFAPSGSKASDLSHSKTVEVQLAQAEPNIANPDASAISTNTLFLIPISLLTAWAISVVIYSDILTILKHGFLAVKHSNQVPCRNCRFFQNNPYLRCAVNPATALTDKASDCSDYCPQNK